MLPKNKIKEKVEMTPHGKLVHVEKKLHKEISPKNFKMDFWFQNFLKAHTKGISFFVLDL